MYPSYRSCTAAPSPHLHAVQVLCAALQQEAEAVVDLPGPGAYACTHARTHVHGPDESCAARRARQARAAAAGQQGGQQGGSRHGWALGSLGCRAASWPRAKVQRTPQSTRWLLLAPIADHQRCLTPWLGSCGCQRAQLPVAANPTCLLARTDVCMHRTTRPHGCPKRTALISFVGDMIGMTGAAARQRGPPAPPPPPPHTIPTPTHARMHLPTLSMSISPGNWKLMELTLSSCTTTCGTYIGYAVCGSHVRARKNAQNRWWWPCMQASGTRQRCGATQPCTVHPGSSLPPAKPPHDQNPNPRPHRRRRLVVVVVVLVGMALVRAVGAAAWVGGRGRGKHLGAQAASGCRWAHGRWREGWEGGVA